MSGYQWNQNPEPVSWQVQQIFDKDKHGSGSENWDSDLCLANLSAFSSPTISQCPGT
jgi:hypothetical protein